MKTVSFTEFRNNASDMLTMVEQGEVLVVLRHGRPVAEISPCADATGQQPSWKRPALRLSMSGRALSAAILEDRERESIL